MRLSLTLLAMAAMPLAASTLYTYTSFDVPRAIVTSAEGINDADVVTGVYTTAGNVRHGFIRSGDGTSYTKFDVPGAIETDASGINDGGTVVGFYQDSADRYHAFLRSTTGAISTFDIPGSKDTYAYAINNAGQIAGAYSLASNLPSIGFLRQPDGSIVTFAAPTPSDTFVTAPGGVNANGTISGTQNSLSMGPQAFIRTPEGGFTNFTAPVPSLYTDAEKINDVGQVVGSILSTAPGTTEFLGYVRSADGSDYSILSVPGAIASGTDAYGINNASVVAGGFTDELGTHGYLASPVPEPSTCFLIGMGLLLFGAGIRRSALKCV